MTDVGPIANIPQETLAWLTEPDTPAVAALTRGMFLGDNGSPQLAELWSRRNEYGPVARILSLMSEDGSWAPPPRDYQKYWGSLWQVHFLGELYADGDDERVRAAARYAFSRQLDDGTWSCSNARSSGSIPCLTANVGRALARLGYAGDERVRAALASLVRGHRESGGIRCTAGVDLYTLNSYCHMLTPKVLLFLGEVPRQSWPEGAEELRDAAVSALRDKQVFRCLPRGSREYYESIMGAPKEERARVREQYLREHSPLQYGDKPGWLKFGFPLSYNSDALEALLALAGVGETLRPEYGPALASVLEAADERMRWRLRTTFNGKMLADVESKGKPSKWLTLRALAVLKAFRG